MSYAETRAVARKAGRDRIVVGGVDVTYFRGVQTPFPGYSLTEPFAYGPTSLSFPQVHAGYERTGVGDLSWAKKGARVVLSRVFEDDSETIDYVGEVASIDPSGRVLRLDVGGQFSGPANMLQEVTQMYRSERDVGRWASLAAARVGLSFDPWFGPDTGIDITHVGGQSLLSWAQYACAMSQDNGLQRAIMPTFWGSDTWHFPVKDYTTVHATAFNDDARVVLTVTDDVSEQPNVVYGTGITPDGVRTTNAKWPHVFQGPAPDYPMPGSFGVGTTNADTTGGDGIDLLYIQLRELGYLPWEVANTGVYTTAIATAVNKLKKKAGLTQNGTMTVAAWNALWNTDVTGYSINGAYREPLAEDDRVREWDRASNGAILGRNPLFDPSVPRVEVDIDYGPGIRKGAMFRHARGILARSLSAKNWVGQLRFNGLGLFVGDQSAADREALNADPDAIFPMRDLRPGMNVIIPDFDGGTLFHVAGADVDSDGWVTATIDTQARDLLEVREILARNADSRRDPRREWNQANRPAKRSDALITSDENFGELDRKVALKGGQWNKIPMIVGQQGQVNRVDLNVTPDAEYAIAIVSKDISEHDMLHKVGNPLVIADESVWETGDIQKWYRERTLLLGDGDGKQPCGYGYRRKLNDAGNRSTAPLTGEYLNDENFTYYCAAGTEVLVYLFIWPDRDCALRKGKLLYCQLSDAA